MAPRRMMRALGRLPSEAASYGAVEETGEVAFYPGGFEKETGMRVKVKVRLRSGCH